MVYRFYPSDPNRFYNAEEISDCLGNLSHGQLSSLHAETNALKKALSVKDIRDGMSRYLPGHFEFLRSETRYDTVTKGPFACRKGYQIKWLMQISQSSSYRNEIDAMRESLFEDTVHRQQLMSAVKQPGPITVFRQTPEISTPLVVEKQPGPITVFRQTPEISIPLVVEGLSSVENTTNSRKRGRPKLTSEEASSKINRLRMQIQYTKTKINGGSLTFGQELDEPQEKSVGEKVIELITEAGCYTETINGEGCTSIVTGLLIQDLISNCGCSVEKLPLIVGTVVTMLFGDVGDDKYSSIVKSHNTYALASERTALLAVLEIRQRFVDREAANRILYSYLIIDASNKKGKGCVGKIIFYVGLDGVVRQLALRLDTTMTKKALGSYKLGE